MDGVNAIYDGTMSDEMYPTVVLTWYYGVSGSEDYGQTSGPVDITSKIRNI